MSIQSIRANYLSLEDSTTKAMFASADALARADCGNLTRITQELKVLTEGLRLTLEVELVHIPDRGRIFRCQRDALMALTSIHGAQLNLVLRRILSLEAGVLTGIDLGGAGLRDLTPLSSLTYLTELYLDANEIEDVSPLTRLTNLKKLSLVNNSIRDLSPLHSLSSLGEINLANNRVSDISLLCQLPALQEVNLYFNPLARTSGNESAMNALIRRGCTVFWDAP